MRVAVIILVILGSLASMGLGIKWISDYNDLKGQIESATKTSEELSKVTDTKEVNDALKEVETTKNCAYVLIICGLISLVTVFLLGKLGKIAALIILACGIAPAFFTPITLVFTFFTVLGGILAFFIKPKAAKAAVQA